VKFFIKTPFVGSYILLSNCCGSVKLFELDPYR